MREFEIPYGRGHLTLRLPDERIACVLSAQGKSSNQQDQETILRAALEHPIGSPRLSELARGKKKILVITSDHTRPVPSALTLPVLLEEIRKNAGNAEVRILIAAGMHRATTLKEMNAKFGQDLVSRECFTVHRSSDDPMTFKGILPSGGELWLNALVDWADLTVAEGFVEPHFFAGFSGGRKAILPGIASRKTVLYNHNAMFIADPKATTGNLEENPIHRDMVFAARQAGLKFILNVLLDGEKRIIAAYAGDVEEAHRAGCRDCIGRTSVKGTPADIVVTSNGGYPLDQNIYQSVKGMTAAEACVKQNGVIIMCAALGDGHGGEAFCRYFADNESAEAVEKIIAGVPARETKPDQWQAQILARVMRRARCIFVTGKENRETIEKMHMYWAENLEDAMDIADSLAGENASVAVIPDGVGVVVCSGREPDSICENRMKKTGG